MRSMRSTKVRAGLIGCGLVVLLFAAIVAYTHVQPILQPATAPSWVNRAAIVHGARDFATGSCISCHAMAGVSNADGAIDLTHEGRRRSVDWLLHEIIHPTSDRPATPPGQEHDLAAYLSSLR